MQPAPKLGRGDGWGEGSAGGWSSGRGGGRAAAARAQASHSWSDVSAGGAVEGDLVRAIGGACAPEIDCVQQALDVDRVGHTDEMAGGATHVGRGHWARAPPCACPKPFRRLAECPRVGESACETHRYGNHVPLRSNASRTARFECVRRFAEDLRRDPALARQWRRELRGKRLSCWCAKRARLLLCHGHVLYYVANCSDAAFHAFLGESGGPADPGLEEALARSQSGGSDALAAPLRAGLAGSAPQAEPGTAADATGAEVGLEAGEVAAASAAAAEAAAAAAPAAGGARAAALDDARRVEPRVIMEGVIPVRLDGLFKDVLEVGGGGDCFNRCLAEKFLGGNGSHMEARGRVASRVASCPWLMPGADEAEQTRLLRRLRTEGVCTDGGVELQAAALEFNAIIQIWTAGPAGDYTFFPRNAEGEPLLAESTDVLELAYCGAHYRLVRQRAIPADRQCAAFDFRVLPRGAAQAGRRD